MRAANPRAVSTGSAPQRPRHPPAGDNRDMEAALQRSAAQIQYPMQGSIIQVNISSGGLPKNAIPEGFITPLGIEGDLHAHPQVHGGPSKAILLVSVEMLEELKARGYALFP